LDFRAAKVVDLGFTMAKNGVMERWGVNCGMHEEFRLLQHSSTPLLQPRRGIMLKANFVGRVSGSYPDDKSLIADSRLL
jgi:hypothetical protein